MGERLNYEQMNELMDALMCELNRAIVFEHPPKWVSVVGWYFFHDGVNENCLGKMLGNGFFEIPRTQNVKARKESFASSEVVQCWHPKRHYQSMFGEESFYFMSHFEDNIPPDNSRGK